MGFFLSGLLLAAFAFRFSVFPLPTLVSVSASPFFLPFFLGGGEGEEVFVLLFCKRKKN